MPFQSPSVNKFPLYSYILPQAGFHWKDKHSFIGKLQNTEVGSPQETIRFPLDLPRKLLLRKADEKRKRGERGGKRKEGRGREGEERDRHREGVLNTEAELRVCVHKTRTA